MKLSVATGKSLAFEPGLLTDLLSRTVERYPGRVAVDFLGAKTTYGQLGEMVERAAAGLRREGVTKGTRVALCLPNTPYYPILFFAVLRAGGIVVNVNPLYTEREIKHLLADSGSEIAVAIDIPDAHRAIAGAATALGLKRIILCSLGDALPPPKRLLYRLLRKDQIVQLPDDGRHVAFADLVRDKARAPAVTTSPDEIAVLQYTGGTTGTPKAAMLTHTNLYANAEAQVVHVGADGTVQERVVGVLPLFHVFALTSVLTFAVRTGAAMLLLPRFELKQLAQLLKRGNPTYLPAVPTIFSALATYSKGRNRLDLSKVRICISGGAPLPAEVATAFERATDAKLIEGYGLSEASPIITCNPLDGARRGSAGLPFPGTTIEIRDPEEPSRIMPAGNDGEICARGPQVMQGYWHQPDATAQTFADGALRTGDIGHLDEDGFLFIVDRIKDLILCGGYNVYPRAIEDALYEHPAVAEAVAIGIPDAYRGQAPKAFVALAEGATATPDELRDFLKDRLSKIELPKEIEIRAALPKTLIGKLSKKELVAEELVKAQGAGAQPAVADA